jgi:hypothetical protein
MNDWLESKILSRDFESILRKLRNESSFDDEDALVFRCLDIVQAVRKEMNNPSGNRAVCKEILQTMTDKGWKWNI